MFFLLKLVVPCILFFSTFNKFYNIPIIEKAERLKYLSISLVWLTSILVLGMIEFGLIKKTGKS